MGGKPFLFWNERIAFQAKVIDPRISDYENVNVRQAAALVNDHPCLCSGHSTCRELDKRLDDRDQVKCLKGGYKILEAVTGQKYFKQYRKLYSLCLTCK